MYNCSIISKPAVSHQDKQDMNIIMSESHVYNVWTLKRQPLNFIQNRDRLYPSLHPPVSDKLKENP